jgi:subtilisin family serine protease
MRAERRARRLALGLILLASCRLGGALLPRVEPAPPRQLVDAKRVIVTLPDARPEEWAVLSRALQAEYDLRQVGEFPLASIGVQCLVLEIPDERSLTAVIAQLGRDARIDLVQRNQVFEAQSEGRTAAQERAYGSLQYGLRAIHADEAHRQSTGRGVKVAVVDTGVDGDHPDLRDRLIASENFVQDGERTFKEDQHGTAVAGIIAALDDGSGIAGVAPDAEILALKACWQPATGSARALCSSWTLAKAVDHALRAGAQVINMSLTGPPDALLVRLLEAADAKGVTVVAAALENAADGPGFPASLPSVLAVVASDAEGTVPIPAWQSSKLAIAAPGVDVLTLVPPTRYDFQSGSSLAAAHVSGVVALLLQRNARLTPADISSRLSRTALRGDSASIGIVDASAALP